MSGDLGPWDTAEGNTEGFLEEQNSGIEWDLYILMYYRYIYIYMYIYIYLLILYTLGLNESDMIFAYIGGFHSHGGTPNSWRLFVRENPLEMDDDWGYPHFGKPSYIYIFIYIFIYIYIYYCIERVCGISGFCRIYVQNLCMTFGCAWVWYPYLLFHVHVRGLKYMITPWMEGPYFLTNRWFSINGCYKLQTLPKTQRKIGKFAMLAANDKRYQTIQLITCCKWEPAILSFMIPRQGHVLVAVLFYWICGMKRTLAEPSTLNTSKYTWRLVIPKHGIIMEYHFSSCFQTMEFFFPLRKNGDLSTRPQFVFSTFGCGLRRWPSHMQPWMTPWTRNGTRASE